MEGMRVIINGSALGKCLAFDLKNSDDLHHCETFLADTYDDGHARSDERIISPLIQ